MNSLGPKLLLQNIQLWGMGSAFRQYISATSLHVEPFWSFTSIRHECVSVYTEPKCANRPDPKTQFYGIPHLRLAQLSMDGNPHGQYHISYDTEHYLP